MVSEKVGRQIWLRSNESNNSDALQYRDLDIKRDFNGKIASQVIPHVRVGMVTNSHQCLSW
jgi:hypothetical protein